MSIDFAFMDKIIELHAEEYVYTVAGRGFYTDFCSMDVVVQPSVPWMSLNEEIKSSGLFFPVDPSPTVSSSNALGCCRELMRFVRRKLEAWWEQVAGKRFFNGCILHSSTKF